MKRDIGLIGPLNVDLLITGQAPTRIDDLLNWSGPADVHLCAAGSAGYIAQDLARFGFQTSLVSTLADDSFGDSILKILSLAGLDMTHVMREAGALSGIGIYMLLFGSKKRPLTYRLPGHQPWPNPITAEQREFLLGNHRHIHCAGYLHFPSTWNTDLPEIFREAKARGLSTSLDPQFVAVPVDTPWLSPIAPLLEHTDLLLVDEDEARKITLEDDLVRAAKFLRKKGPTTIVIKCGSRGSLLAEGDETRECPAVRVSEQEIVDSIGAGDAFDTGMIYGLLNGWDAGRSQRFATLAAASTLHGSGGTESLAPVAVLEKEVESL
ncbi:MAG TPA: carbohydrate kinase family protein [Anaerolineaceae bacterium]|nr:carbohydrate kinase family protein [Anaerolineaceae bacterium]